MHEHPTEEQLNEMQPTAHQKFFTLCNIGANILAAEVSRACSSGQVHLVQNIPADHLLWTRDYLHVSLELREVQYKAECEQGGLTMVNPDSQEPHIQAIKKQLTWIERVIAMRENPGHILLPSRPTPVVASVRAGLNIKGNSP